MTNRADLLRTVRSLYPQLDEMMTEVAVDFHLKYPDSDVDAVLGGLLTGHARDFFSELESKRTESTLEGERSDAGPARDQSEATSVPANPRESCGGGTLVRGEGEANL
jgi:hypothetical protein